MLKMIEKNADLMVEVSMRNNSSVFNSANIYVSIIIGQARTAEVQRDARVGEAQAKMQSSIAEAKAEMERMESKLMNDTEIAHFKRDYDFKKAGYDVEVNTAKANADLAYTLQVGFSLQ